jgi:hypothetical protein
MSAINKLMAKSIEIDSIFADLKKIADRCDKIGFTYMLTASVYNLNKEYTNEMHANGMTAEESRILLFMHQEEITKNQITNLLNKK